ncbi:unnamed protein product [Urochloa humidicola]
MMPKPSPKTPFPPNIYPIILQKVEGMKKLGAPTKEISKALLEVEEDLKLYQRLWKSNERQVQGLFRNGPSCRAHIALATLTSAVVLVKGCDVSYRSATQV